MSRRTELFGTRSDYLGVLSVVQERRPLRFALADLSPSSTAEEYTDFAALPGLGVATTDDCNKEPCYLCVDRDVSIVIRDVPQVRGGVLYAIDQLVNHESVTFQPGGVRPDGVVIAGNIGTAWDDRVSREIYNLFRSVIRSQFTHVRVFWVGPESMTLLRSGARLTQRLRAPRDCDLRLPPR